MCDNNSDQHECSSVVEDDVHTNSTDTEKCDTLKSPDIYAMLSSSGTASSEIDSCILAGTEAQCLSRRRNTSKQKRSVTRSSLPCTTEASVTCSEAGCNCDKRENCGCDNEVCDAAVEQSAADTLHTHIDCNAQCKDSSSEQTAAKLASIANDTVNNSSSGRNSCDESMDVESECTSVNHKNCDQHLIENCEQLTSADNPESGAKEHRSSQSDSSGDNSAPRNTCENPGVLSSDQPTCVDNSSSLLFASNEAALLASQGLEAEDTLSELPQRLRSASEAQGLRRITVHYPSSVTVIYNRRTWPLPQQSSLPADVEYGTDALSMEGSAASTPVQPAQPVPRPRCAGLSTHEKTLCLRPEFKQRFELAISCIRRTIGDNIPLTKLQHMTGCLREINKQVSDFQAEALKTWLGACSDDLIDMLVILLCNCDPKDTMRLYPHLMLLTDLIPPFFQGGPYSFALVQFSVAFQFIQERLLIKNRICQPDITLLD